MFLRVFWTLRKAPAFGGRFPSASLQGFSGFGADQGPRGSGSMCSFSWVMQDRVAGEVTSSQPETIQRLAEMKGHRPEGRRTGNSQGEEDPDRGGGLHV